MSHEKNAFAGAAWTHLLWPFVTLVILIGSNLLFTENFGRIQTVDGHLYGSLIDVFHRAVPVTLVAIGMTLVIATKGVDLAVGSVMAIAGAVAAVLLERGVAVPWVILAGLVAGIVAGVWNGALVAWLKMQPIVATLILMVAGRGIAQLITQGQKPTFDVPAFSFLGSGFLFGLPFSITLVALFLLFTVLLTRKTAIGLFIESVGSNATGSRYAGINEKTVVFVVYAFSGLTAALAGLMITADIQQADANNTGLFYELDAILAVVIGGTALQGGRYYLGGTVLGALIIQALTTTILTRGIAVEWTLVVKALVVLLVCLLQSDVFRTKVFGRLRRSQV